MRFLLATLLVLFTISAHAGQTVPLREMSLSCDGATVHIVKKPSKDLSDIVIKPQGGTSIVDALSTRTNKYMAVVQSKDAGEYELVSSTRDFHLLISPKDGSTVFVDLYNKRMYINCKIKK